MTRECSVRCWIRYVARDEYVAREEFAAHTSMLSLVKAGMSKEEENASTSARRAATLGLPSRPFFQSFNILPWLACTSKHRSTALPKKSATTTKSFSTRPREVIAGVPMRTPPGDNALASPKTAFLFKVM